MTRASRKEKVYQEMRSQRRQHHVVPNRHSEDFGSRSVWDGKSLESEQRMTRVQLGFQQHPLAVVLINKDNSRKAII